MKIQKKKWLTFAAAALIATGVLGMTSLAAGRADLNANTGGPGEKASVDVSTGEKPGDTQERQQDQQTAVITQILAEAGTGNCNADISYYKKENGNWELKWTEKGYVGRNGITDNKKEGDGATPSGVYSFDLAFGLLDDPGSVLPYHKIAEGDFWGDDPASPHYNQLVNDKTTAKDWNSGEDLIKATPYYNYALNLDYNKERTPGEGSAIFLHCFKASGYQGSSGCICLPESRMKELLGLVDTNTRIVIAKDAEHLNLGEFMK